MNTDIALLLFILILIFLFAGEPDVHDALIQYLLQTN